MIGGVHPYKTNVAILDHLVREVLPNVDVLCTLPAPDDVFPHSMHTVLSLYTCVGDFWAEAMFSKRLLRLMPSVAAVDAD